MNLSSNSQVLSLWFSVLRRSPTKNFPIPIGRGSVNEEVMVLKTEWGREFVLTDFVEIKKDGTRRTRLFYCDLMANWQKDSLINVHWFIREIYPKQVDLYALGNSISSQLNSYNKKKLNNKTSFSILRFFNSEMANRFLSYGLTEIPHDQVTLKPHLLRSCKFKITLFLYLKQKIHHFIFFWHSLHALSWIEIIPPQWGQVYFAFCCIIKLSNP